MIILTKVSFQYPGTDPVLSNLDLAISHGHYGLVADNGVGKTTLLRLLAGELHPTTGSVQRQGRTAILHQYQEYSENWRVADLLLLGPIFDALRLLELGDSRPDLYEIVGSIWDVQAEADKRLARIGLTSMDLARNVGTLSGGELTRVRLAGLLANRPEILILDEPTNHLDLSSRRFVADFINDFKGVCVVASHDQTILSAMDHFVELRRDQVKSSCRVISGNFAFFMQHRAVLDEASEQRVAAGKIALQEAKRQATDVRERQSRRTAEGARQAKKGGMPKILLGARKRKAESTASRLASAHEQVLNQKVQQLKDAKDQLFRQDKVKISLPESSVPVGKVMLRLREYNVRLTGSHDFFWKEGLQLDLCGPQRVALIGDNGTGKSTLIKAIYNHNSGVDQEVFVAREHLAYLDQRLEFLEAEKTVLDNFRNFSPQLEEAERRTRLGGMLLGERYANTLTSSLSGGERMRLALACLLLGDRPTRFLLLDEPTNHLDMTSSRLLGEALNAFQGAMIVVSHDVAFLQSIKIETWWRMTRRGIVK